MSYFVEIQWTAKCDQQVRCFRQSPLLLDHTGEKPFVLFSEDSLTVHVFTAYTPTASDVTESMVFVASKCSLNFVELIQSVIIFSGSVLTDMFLLIKTEMDIKPLRSNSCTIADIDFFGIVVDVRSLFFFTTQQTHNQQYNDDNPAHNYRKATHINTLATPYTRPPPLVLQQLFFT